MGLGLSKSHLCVTVWTVWLALLGTALTFGSASAADFSGDCCADLEERVAELEATTVRKGNKKVTVTISGWVTKSVNWWDDGDIQSVVVGGKGEETQSHFSVTGSATIAPGWTGGYTIDIEAPGASFGFFANQFDETIPDLGGIRTHLSYMWLSSDKWGTLNWGYLHQATDNLTLLIDLSGTVIESNAVFMEGNAFFLRPTGAAGGLGGLVPRSWASFTFCNMSSVGGGADCNAIPAAGVKYQSPTFGGFTVLGGYYTDEVNPRVKISDVALKYDGDLGNFKVSAAAGYTHAKGEGVVQRNNDLYQTGASVMHMPTGLWFYGAWWQEQIGGRGNTPFGVSSSAQTGNVFFTKAGIKRNWNSLGATVLWGEYGLYEDQFSGLANTNVCAVGGGFNGGGGPVAGAPTGVAPICAANPTVFVTGSEATRFGLGGVQEIDSAAMHLYARWVHAEIDVNLVNGLGARVNQGFEDWDLIQAGGIIFF